MSSESSQTGEVCAHSWPSELNPDSTCERCGLPYREWPEEIGPGPAPLDPLPG
jgi:hypothetical protein